MTQPNKTVNYDSNLNLKIVQTLARFDDSSTPPDQFNIVNEMYYRPTYYFQLSSLIKVNQ